jgi:hypothetical protein
MKNNTLEELSLADNDIGAAGAIALAQTLEHNFTCTRVDLSGNHTGADGLEAFEQLLKLDVTRVFSKLDLSDNQAPARSLSDLDLLHSMNGLRSYTQEAVDVLSDELVITGSVADLQFGQHLGDPAALALAASLRQHRAFTSVNLEGNSIGCVGVTAIALTLAIDRTLRSINLSRNKIGDDGAFAVARALKDNPTLTSVSLARNNIGDDGVLAIAHAVHGNPRTSITHLELEGNALITEVGQGVLGAAAHANSLREILAHRLAPDSTSLDLSARGLRSIGAEVLAEALLQRGKVVFQ